MRFPTHSSLGFKDITMFTNRLHSFLNKSNHFLMWIFSFLKLLLKPIIGFLCILSKNVCVTDEICVVLWYLIPCLHRFRCRTTIIERKSLIALDKVIGNKNYKSFLGISFVHSCQVKYKSCIQTPLHPKVRLATLKVILGLAKKEPPQCQFGPLSVHGASV